MSKNKKKITVQSFFCTSGFGCFLGYFGALFFGEFLSADFATLQTAQAAQSNSMRVFGRVFYDGFSFASSLFGHTQSYLA